MKENQHTIMCVDDEENILRSLKRLLRNEGYRQLNASSGEEALNMLKENEVHLVMCDQRMSGMSGTEFLGIVKDNYPDTIRVILSGYTEIDSITELINKGHIYKFFLKPWNDQNLKLEIKHALEQYDLLQTNKNLSKKISEQNEKLISINENLEMLVNERTRELEIQNQALELSRTILDDMPIAVIGVSTGGMIALINREAQSLPFDNEKIEIGRKLTDYFSTEVEKKVKSVLRLKKSTGLKGYRLSGISFDMNLIPLSGRFKNKGVLMIFMQSEC
ncbi:MAG: response regulator [Deltaproteobacteria bacterium]|nr:response regulator [Deltaproteobacteria bacterium]